MWYSGTGSPSPCFFFWSRARLSLCDSNKDKFFWRLVAHYAGLDDLYLDAFTQDFCPKIFDRSHSMSNIEFWLAEQSWEKFHQGFCRQGLQDVGCFARGTCNWSVGGEPSRRRGGHSLAPWATQPSDEIVTFAIVRIVRNLRTFNCEISWPQIAVVLKNDRYQVWFYAYFSNLWEAKGA